LFDNEGGLGFNDRGVQILPKTIEHRGDMVDIDILVKEKEKTGSLSFGVAYGSLQWLVLIGKFEKQNIFGTGQAVDFRTDFNYTRQFVNLNFSNPYFFDSEWLFGVNFYFSRDTTASVNLKGTEEGKDFQSAMENTFKDCYESERLRASNPVAKQQECVVRLSHLVNRAPFSPFDFLHGNARREFSQQGVNGGFTLGRHITDTLRLSINYDIGYFVFSDSVDNDLFPTQDASGLRNPMKLNIEYDARNNRLLPSDGVYLSGSVAHDGLLGKFNYLTTTLNARFYRRLLWKIIFRINAQYSQHFNIGDQDIPFDRLFGLGGIDSLRGFDVFSIGPSKTAESIYKIAREIGLGDYYSNVVSQRVYGGQKQLYTNIELQFPLWSSRFFGVVFLDIGSAYNTWASMDLRSNWGVGLRAVDIPMLGAIRFEVGFPFSPRQLQTEEAPQQFTEILQRFEEPHRQFNFTIGVAF